MPQDKMGRIRGLAIDGPELLLGSTGTIAHCFSIFATAPCSPAQREKHMKKVSKEDALTIVLETAADAEAAKAMLNSFGYAMCRQSRQRRWPMRVAVGGMRHSRTTKLKMRTRPSSIEP